MRDPNSDDNASNRAMETDMASPNLDTPAETECPDCGSQDPDFCQVWTCDNCGGDLTIPVLCTDLGSCSAECAGAMGVEHDEG